MATRKYNSKFNRDYDWYVSMIPIFDFDGCYSYFDKNGNSIIVYDSNGADAKESFFEWDSNGRIIPTSEPNLLQSILKAKGSANLHIMMYAEDRAKGILSKKELQQICEDFNAPQWFYDAVERQKMKYWNKALN